MTDAQRSRRTLSLAILGVTAVLSTVLLFAHLGTYALWDDEAETALGAQGILSTGDTTAVLEHNFVARRAGINLKGLHDRVTPPLPSYLTALSFFVGERDAFFARLPFALAGLAAVGLMLLYLWRRQVSVTCLVFAGLAILTNVALFLYFRQCRYYGTSLLLVVATMFVYLEGLHTARRRVVLGILLGLLALSHVLVCAQICAALAVDWFVFERRATPFRRSWIWEIGVPFVIVAAPAVLVWNPMRVPSGATIGALTIADRVRLLWLNVRDLFRGEFFPLAFVVYAPLAYAITRRRWFLRGGAALLVILGVTAALSYQPVTPDTDADVRYVIAVIPIGIALTTSSFTLLFENRRWGVPIALPLLLVSVVSGRPRSVPLSWYAELLNPIEEPYTPVASWLRRNVPARASVLVFPDYMMYPLMFHAPDPTYAWQLEPDGRFAGQFAPINYKTLEAPDYVIAFGFSTDAQDALRALGATQHAQYKLVQVIDTHAGTVYRPEIFWRDFHTVQPHDLNDKVVILMRR